jgi:hypothetical protein
MSDGVIVTVTRSRNRSMTQLVNRSVQDTIPRLMPAQDRDC